MPNRLRSLAMHGIDQIAAYDLGDPAFRQDCRQALASAGVVTLPGFLQEPVLAALVREARQAEDQAYFTTSTHNVYLSPKDPNLPDEHAYNRQVVSTKGCVCDDVVGASSALRALYNAPQFKEFLCAVLDQAALYPYADPLSSINIHFAPAGKELGWHFDNSEFAITLLLQKPEGGGAFEYVKDLRDAQAGEMNFDGVQAVLDGLSPDVSVLDIEPGTLVLFRGRNSLHRVTPTQGAVCRYLVVLAYNSAPGISLSENARQTFYGRLG